jgi:hypothetical protein
MPVVAAQQLGGSVTLLSGVRVVGCLTMAIALAVGLFGFAALGPLAWVLAAGVGIIGVCMALVTKVK